MSIKSNPKFPLAGTDRRHPSVIQDENQRTAEFLHALETPLAEVPEEKPPVDLRDAVGVRREPPQMFVAGDLDYIAPVDLPTLKSR